ncbi:formyltransferase family protein [Polluticoccus soli]|uniref:formyltransferase family protein n=1 Tax=Polluticoccus soli TaxID=3034150 RepID=UPI0023E29455|nr:formyltransferase family protein [Flavipsychrobacter sp. JY13-12]
MVRKKIVFLGSKPIGYRCLQYLLGVQEQLNVEVSGILTQQRKEFSGDNDLVSLAKEYSVPVLESLDALPECDIIYSVQYHQILKGEHIRKASQIAVNLHMAPLPEYRGSNQFSYAILEEKSEFGTTIHQIDERIDHGAILFQKRFPIPDNLWVNDLYKLTFNASVLLFQQTLKHIVNGNYTPVSQQSLVHKYGTSLHFRQEVGDLKRIDLSWDREKIERHIRATAMPGFEPPYAEINGEKIYFSTTAS